MTIASHRASIQARLLSQFAKDANALWVQFQQEYVLAEQGLYDDKPAPDGSRLGAPLKDQTS